MRSLYTANHNHHLSSGFIPALFASPLSRNVNSFRCFEEQVDLTVYISLSYVPPFLALSCTVTNFFLPFCGFHKTVKANKRGRERYRDVRLISALFVKNELSDKHPAHHLKLQESNRGTTGNAKQQWQCNANYRLLRLLLSDGFLNLFNLSFFSLTFFFYAFFLADFTGRVSSRPTVKVHLFSCTLHFLVLRPSPLTHTHKHRNKHEEAQQPDMSFVLLIAFTWLFYNIKMIYGTYVKE